MKPGKSISNKSPRLWAADKYNSLWLVLAILIASIAGYFLLISHAAPVPPTIYLNPASKTLAVNTTFTVQVRENSGTSPVNAVQANFSYPNTLLTFVSIDFTGTAFGTAAPSSESNGVVSIAAGATCTTTCATLTGDQLVATVTFTTKTTGGSAAMAFTTGTSLVSTVTFANLLASLAATGGGTYVIDNVPPTVSVSSPASGSTLSAGSTVSVTSTATDASSAISSVDIYIDGAKATTLTTSPYTYSWNTSGLALGSHTVQAKATDAVGNIGSSATNTVTLADQTPPTVSITAPTASTKVAGTVNVSVTAADNAGGSGLAKVEFYVDGALKATNTASPYSFSWDSKTASDGSRSLTAKAYDNAATPNVATSPAVAVTVDNTAPTTPGAFQSSGSTFSTVTLTWTASSDTNGVTGYRLTRNGTALTTLSGTTLTFGDSGLAAGTSYTYTVVALDGLGNTSGAASVTVSTVAQKPGDLNADNIVNVQDLSILLFYYGSTNAAGDINKDGIVNAQDLSILLFNFGT